MAPSKRPFNGAPDEEQEEESTRKKPRGNRLRGSQSQAPVAPDSSSADVIGYGVAKNLKFRTYIAAAYWLEQGCPRLDFLTTLGLQSLADVKWNIICPSLIREFVANYNLISQSFNLSYEGVLSFKRSFESVDHPVKLFKDGAYQKDLGYRHDMLMDTSLAPIFSLIAEVVQLRVSSGYSSRNLIEVIVQGLQGFKINWSEYMFQNILKELRRMKQKAHSTPVFGAGPLITHIFQDFPDEDPKVSNEVSSEPLVEIKSPVPSINPSPSVNLEIPTAIPSFESRADVVPSEHPVAIPITDSEQVDTKGAVEAIDLNSSCSVLTTLCSSTVPPSIRQQPAAKTFSPSLFPVKSAFTSPQPPSQAPAGSAPSEMSISPPFSKMFYGINPKMKITSLFSEATRTLHELYTEEEVQKRVNQMLNATTGQLNFERMIRERTEEDLKEAKRQRDQFKSELMMAHSRIAVLEKSESQLRESNERLDKSRKDLEDDIESYSSMLLEHQESLPKLHHQCEEIAVKMKTVEANFQDIRKQVNESKKKLGDKSELLRKAQAAAAEAQKQYQQSQQEQMALQQQLEDLQGAVTLLRTELAAKELPYDESIWEKIKGTARKHTHEEYAKLVDTIADLQEQLEQHQARQAEDGNEED